jgi:hypothetical protein
MPKPEFVYKIQRTSDGKFRDGGTDKFYSPKGKVWKRLSDLVNHLKYNDITTKRVFQPGQDAKQLWTGYYTEKLTAQEYLDQFPAEDEVVEYEIVEKRRIPIREFMRERIPAGIK